MPESNDRHITALDYHAAHAPPCPAWWPAPESPGPPKPKEWMAFEDEDLRLAARDHAYGELPFEVLPAELVPWALQAREYYDGRKRRQHAAELAREVSWRWFWALAISAGRLAYAVDGFDSAPDLAPDLASLMNDYLRALLPAQPDAPHDRPAAQPPADRPVKRSRARKATKQQGD